jgi:hypothetical protein
MACLSVYPSGIQQTPLERQSLSVSIALGRGGGKVICPADGLSHETEKQF